MLKSIYRIWIWVGKRFGFSGRYFRELAEHQKQLNIELEPIFENLSFMKERNNGNT